MRQAGWTGRVGRPDGHAEEFKLVYVHEANGCQMKISDRVLRRRGGHGCLEPLSKLLGRDRYKEELIAAVSKLFNSVSLARKEINGIATNICICICLFNVHIQM